MRFNWLRQHEQWLKSVLCGHYRLSPMQVYRQYDRSWVQWSAMDALVLKWVALQVEHELPKHPHCHHLKGHDGVAGASRRVTDAWRSSNWHYVYRTDIRGYYRHILKHQVDSQLRWHVHDPVCRELCRQWLYYSVEDGGDIHTPKTGICRGSALSPLIGGSLLWHIDDDFSKREDLFYARYMDDFIIFTRTRWHARRAIKRLLGALTREGFDTHPDKTKLGRIEKGFDWLGQWYAEEGICVSPRAKMNHRERMTRLYEQARRRKLSQAETERRVREYETRWMTWAKHLLRNAVGLPVLSKNV